MIVQIREIPDEGLHLQGESQKDIFELNEEGVSVAGPMKYDLQATIPGDSLLVMGEVSAPFELRCSRCLESFEQTISVPEFTFCEPVEGRATIDLTDSIREDILLALPIHPHCEDGTPPRECQAAGLFEESEHAPATEENPESGDNAWSGLEDLDPPKD